MKNTTRIVFNAYTAHLAEINGAPAGTTAFAVSPTVEQTLTDRIQESADFLKQINMPLVEQQSAEVLGMGTSGPVAGRTDTDKADRQPRSVTDLEKHTYLCQQTNFDTYTTYDQLDAWAKFPDFQTRVRDAIITRQGLDRIMIGWNGTSAAKDTDRNANPLLQDVNVGWLEHIRQDAPAQVMQEGVQGSGKIYVDATDGDYKNIDALVYDVVNELIKPWYQDDTELVVICGRKMLSDKYFPIINDAGDNQNKLAAQVLVSQKQIGGLKAVRVPFFPEDALLITKLSNLSIYWQEGARRRHIEEEPKRNRIVNYESSNDAYVVEDYDCAGLVENIVIGPRP